MRGMKVLDLRCANDHRFEGWFDSDDDWLAQRDNAMLACPLCGDKAVERRPSAPRLNLSSAGGGDDKREVMSPGAVQAQWLRAMREVVRRTEDVGERFADEARRIHYGEVEARGIRGKATQQQTESLLDEGIEVMPLPMPALLKEPLQ